MKTTLKIVTLLLIATPSIARAQNNSYQNIPGSSGGGSGMSTYNQQYFQQNPLPQPMPQSGVGAAGASGYQQPQQMNVVPVYPGAGAPQSVPGNPSQY